MSISELIEQQVQERPDAVAVRRPGPDDGPGGGLTYRELGRAANRLAARLRDRGITRGDRVAIALRPGPETVTAFLGIVRAGAVCVPLDPADRVQRRRLIVRDSAAVAVLTGSAGAADYAGLDAVVLALDAEAPEIARRREALPVPSAGPDDALCVRYASGAVEGVVVSQRAVLDLVRSAGSSPVAPDGVVARAGGGPAFEALAFAVRTALTSGAGPAGGTDRDDGNGRDGGGREVAGRAEDRVELCGRSFGLGEVESVLSAHPAVSAAAVSLHEGADGDRRLVAHVVPAVVAPAAAEEDAQTARWKEIHEALHAKAAARGPGEDFTGWNSSYDALPIPLEELREWRCATVERIRELPRRRVLEIGVGTGLLLARLARDEEVHEYWATDFSPAAIAALTAGVEADAVLKDKVRLDCRGAEDTGGLPAGHFDAIVVNSVIQYFPGLARLRTVLERLLPLLAPGGSILLGDVRSLDLARCLQTGIALARPGAAEGDREALRGAIGRQVAAESELLLSPALFGALARDLPAVRAVDVRIKRGVHHNELSRYRYDVLLSTAEPVADLRGAPVVRWDADAGGGLEVVDRATAARPAVLRLAAIPNRRVHDEYAAMRSLFDPLEGIDLAPQDAPAPDPEALCERAERLGYRALPTWGETPGLLDIVLLDAARVPAGVVTGVYVAPGAGVRGRTGGGVEDGAGAGVEVWPGAGVEDGAGAGVEDGAGAGVEGRTGGGVEAGAGVEVWAGTPAALEHGVDLEAVLRAHLRERLPEHMVPSALMTLRALPRDATGAVDRAALPVDVPAAGHGGTQPGTPVQEIVRDLFAEVVGLPRHRVRAESDFFRIGGDAPAAARLLSRVREALGADPGGRALYGAPTPAAFALLVGEARAAVTGPGETAGDSRAFSLRLRGPLQVRALEAALEDLGRRHEALRNSRLGSAGTRLRALAAEDHLLELALPADSVDLWSHVPLAADLARAYGARAGGGVPHRRPAGLDAAPRAVFGDRAPAVLPGSGPRSGPASYGTLDRSLDAGVHARLTRLAAEQGATVFMVVHAALAALLSRLGAQDPVTVAAPVPARDTAALREAVGPYGRVLALTVDTFGDPAFGELLRRVRERDLAAYRDGEAALAALPGGVALAVVQECVGRFEAAGLSVGAEQCTPAVPAADWGLTLTERQGPAGEAAGIAVTVTFRHETLGERAAAVLADQFTAVLRSALEAPATRLSRLRLLPGAVAGSGVWAGAQVPLVRGDVASLFAAQVARAPGALALKGLDYAELDARSDLLAHALIEHRAGPGSCVLTALSSPAGFAVAALAVAKTGAALVPVDPSLDLDPSLHPVVLLLDETADLLLPGVPGAARLVREEMAGPRPAAGHWPVTQADRIRPLRAEDPLLLLPGEGGTVAVGGEALSAAARADAAWLVRGYPDGDAAIGLLGALVGGARVHVPDGSLTCDVPHEVLGWLGRQGARVVLGGADDVLSALVSLARSEGARLTVSGGWAEARLVVEHTPGAPARPAAGHRAYLLDARLCPVGPGRTGSLYIAGVGVARGYLGAGAAGGERFLPDPFAGPQGTTARMWRTGRAARLDEYGNLRVLDGAAHDDPFDDASAAFVVLADAAGHRALWPAAATVPKGWYETRAQDLYEL
ncbi:AMP-binding protein [Streptomyces sp. SAS_267]|uniref:AMP-binding protein n=1 Tax=Streptomyces sp. SAS_267 TaxID=3412750 RepID=UPI00403C9D75